MPMTFTDRARLAWRILRAKEELHTKIMPDGEEGNPVRIILTQAAKQFRSYEASHMAKAEAMTHHELDRAMAMGQDPTEKARVNARWAEILERAAEALAR